MNGRLSLVLATGLASVLSVLSCSSGGATRCDGALCAEESAGAEAPTITRTPLGGAACGALEVGVTEGAYAQDFATFDQSGQTVLLSDFCGKVVALQMGAMWCPTCQNEAKHLQETQAKYAARGLLLLTLLAENAAFEPIELHDLGLWANYFELSTPILADPNWQIWDRYFEVHATPRSLLIGPDGKILKVGYVFTDEDYEAALSTLGR